MDHLRRSRSARSPALLLAIALTAVACTGGSSGTAIPAPSGSASTAAASGRSPADGSPPGSPTESASSRPTPGEGEFVNPVIDAEFADPHVINVDGTYYAYATGIQSSRSGSTGVQWSRSTDLVEWEPAHAIRIQTIWATRDFWAPEVALTSAGFVMYYTGRSQLDTPGRDPAQCVGRAVADSPEGPFVDEVEEPLICQPELGGTIDASPFVDQDGSRYLLFKNDGNCCSRPVDLWIQPLSDDGLQVTGEATSLGVDNDRLWEGPLIEAPTLWFHEGTYYLFYSANEFFSATYAVGYATSKTILGPYVDAPENPILHADFPELMADPSLRPAGPGHQSIVEDGDGDLWMAYHAWSRDAIGYEAAGERSMWIDELTFEDGKAVVLGPDDEPQPVP